MPVWEGLQEAILVRPLTPSQALLPHSHQRQRCDTLCSAQGLNYSEKIILL